jgi:hypothetical protein
MEIRPRPIAMASRARAALPARGREVTCSTVSRPDNQPAWRVLSAPGQLAWMATGNPQDQSPPDDS